jgi:hypothetical protein
MADCSVLEAWGADKLPFDGPMDVKYFCDIPNAEVARRCLSFLHDGSNAIELAKRHVQSDIHQMWKATFRACLAHGVELSTNDKQYARMLGVVIS